MLIFLMCLFKFIFISDLFTGETFPFALSISYHLYGLLRVKFVFMYLCIYIYVFII